MTTTDITSALIRLRSYISRLEGILLLRGDYCRCTICSEIYPCEEGEIDLNDWFTCAQCISQLPTIEGED